jgi:hypothetical protein
MPATLEWGLRRSLADLADEFQWDILGGEHGFDQFLVFWCSEIDSPQAS